MVFQVRERGLGGAALRRNVDAHLGDVLAGGLGHAAGAGQRLLRQQRGGRRIEPERGAGVAQRFRHQEEVGRAGARQRRDGVEVGFGLDPDGPPGCGEHRFHRGAPGRVDGGPGIETRDALTDQGRRVGHGPDHAVGPAGASDRIAADPRHHAQLERAAEMRRGRLRGLAEHEGRGLGHVVVPGRC